MGGLGLPACRGTLYIKIDNKMGLLVTDEFYNLLEAYHSQMMYFSLPKKRKKKGKLVLCLLVRSHNA